jgi:hypothetical protein
MYRNESYALEIMKTGLEFLSNAKLRSNIYSNNNDPFRALLVYCIKEIKPDMWLPLNRNYDVLGLSSDGMSDYKSDKYDHILIHTKDINFDLLWDNDTDRAKSENFYTMTDSTFPTYYYGTKNQDKMKRWQRYEIVIRHTFFGENTGKNFKWAWEYKNKISVFKESYEKNLQRFKLNSL